MTKKTKPNRTISILFLLLNVIIWGAALPIVKPSLDVISPFQFLFLRFAVASLFSLPLLIYFLPKIKNKGKILAIILFVELFQILELGFLYTGLSLTSSLEASLIATTTPIFTVIGGIIFLREKQERREWLGLGLAVSGTFLLAIEPLLRGNGVETGFSLTGNILIFLQNICLAVYFLLAKKYYHGIPKLFATTISFFIATIAFFFLSALQPVTSNLQLSALLQPTVLLAIAYMSVLGSIVGLTAYIKGQDGIEASEASLFSYLQPLIYIPLATIWLHESLTWPMLIAVAIIGIGVWIAQVRRG